MFHKVYKVRVLLRGALPTAASAAVKHSPKDTCHFGLYEPYKLYELKGLFALYLMSCSRFDDFEEICRFQRCTTDKSTIYVRIGANSVGISCVTASSVKD